MPCYDGRDNGRVVEVDNPETARRLRLALKRLDAATKAACEMRNKLEQHATLTRSTRDWIREHDELDAKRLRK